MHISWKAGMVGVLLLGSLSGCGSVGQEKELSQAQTKQEVQVEPPQTVPEKQAEDDAADAEQNGSKGEDLAADSSISTSNERGEGVSANADSTKAAANGQEEALVHQESLNLNGSKYDITYFNSGEFDYTSFTITRKDELLFDSRAAGIQIEGGFKESDSQWTKAVPLPDRNAFVFSLADSRPDSANIVIEGRDGTLQVSVFDDVELWFDDVDDDGTVELLACPSLGQIPLGPARIAIYQWRNGQYEPDAARTRQYWEEQLAERLKKYKDSPDDRSLDSLLSAYMLLGRADEALKQFPSFYKWAGQTENDKGFVTDYREMLSNSLSSGEYESIYADWMAKAEPLGKEGVHTTD